MSWNLIEDKTSKGTDDRQIKNSRAALGWERERLLMGVTRGRIHAEVCI